MSAYPSRIITMPSKGTQAANPDARLSRQIDELQRISLEERDKKLGPNWIQDMRDFYNLATTSGSVLAPSYRPRVSIPQLQTLMLNEATDLTSDSPKVYILKDGKRDQPREKAFQANWRQGLYNMQLLYAAIWSLLASNGWLQIGFSPSTRSGKGSAWMASRDPDTVHPDPCSENDKDWQYLILEDYMYIDEVQRFWPERGALVKPKYAAAPQEHDSMGLQMPPGPMSMGSEMPAERVYNTSRVRVRHVFVFDNTLEAVANIAGTQTAQGLDLIVPPKFRYKYPNGRWIVECEEVTLADGPNWCPKLPDDERGTFPLVRLPSLPSIGSMYSPSPVKFTRGLQELAEKELSNVHENAIRLNNGVWFVDEQTGIDVDAFGGMPGEVQIIHAGSPIPQMVFPKDMPKHMTDLPMQLLAMQKELQGFTPSRSGQPSAGNVSPDLFDASLFQSQTLTRLRGRLMAATVERSAQIVFHIMARFLTRDQSFGVPFGGDIAQHKWTAVESPYEYEIMLDPNSITPVSGAALRTVAMGLAKAGQLPNKYLLEMLDIPGAAEISEEQTRQLELSAMAKLKRPR